MVRALSPESNEAIGERLRLIRLAYGRVQGYPQDLKQVEFANICGLSRQLLNNAEAGRERIGLDSAKLIYRRTGADLLYIYYGETRALPLALGREIERLQQTQRSKKA